MAMSPKDKAKFQEEWKKPGNVKKGEIITPGAVVRGVAKAAAKVVGKQTTKQAIPTKIKTPTQSYDIKQTATGKIKATNTKTGISVTFPKDTKLNINKIKQAHAQKFINKSK
jgi:small-conductance mechanosensitive channel